MIVMMFVLDDPIYLDKILDAWSNLKVSRITVMDSSGLYSRSSNHKLVGPRYGESSFEQRGNFIIFAFTEDEESTQVCLKEVEQIVGDLNEPNTGIFTFWPVTSSKGILSG